MDINFVLVPFLGCMDDHATEKCIVVAAAVGMMTAAAVATGIVVAVVVVEIAAADDTGECDSNFVVAAAVDTS